MSTIDIQFSDAGLHRNIQIKTDLDEMTRIHTIKITEEALLELADILLRNQVVAKIRE